MKYIFLIVLLSCSPPKEECLSESKVKRILKQKYRTTYVLFEDGKTRAMYSPTLKPGDKRCSEWGALKE